MSFISPLPVQPIQWWICHIWMPECVKSLLTQPKIGRSINGGSHLHNAIQTFSGCQEFEKLWCHRCGARRVGRERHTLQSPHSYQPYSYGRTSRSKDCNGKVLRVPLIEHQQQQKKVQVLPWNQKMKCWLLFPVKVTPLILSTWCPTVVVTQYEQTKRLIKMGCMLQMYNLLIAENINNNKQHKMLTSIVRSKQWNVVCYSLWYSLWKWHLQYEVLALLLWL